MRKKPTKSTKVTLDGWAILRTALRTNHRQELTDNQAIEEQEKFRLDQRHRKEMAQINLFLNPMGWAQAINRYQLQQSHNQLVTQTRHKWTLDRQQGELVNLDKWITHQQKQGSDTAYFDQLHQLFSWSLTQQQRHSYHHLLNQGYTLIITDLHKQILWASQSFVLLTGYQPKEVMGQRAGILQGPSTDQVTVSHIREQLALDQSVEAELLNYTKSGESYTCHMQIEPLYNHQGLVTHFLAVEWAI